MNFSVTTQSIMRLPVNRGMMTDQSGDAKKEFVEYDLMQNAHRVIINYDEESGLFKAYVDDIPTTQVYGKTKGEAFAHLMQIFYPQSRHPEDL